MLAANERVAPVKEKLVERILIHLQYRAGDKLKVGVLLFSKQFGFLEKSSVADDLIQKIIEQEG